jgi:hypothetical protein
MIPSIQEASATGKSNAPGPWSQPLVPETEYASKPIANSNPETFAFAPLVFPRSTRSMDIEDNRMPVKTAKTETSSRSEKNLNLKWVAASTKPQAIPMKRQIAPETVRSRSERVMRAISPHTLASSHRASQAFNGPKVVFTIRLKSLGCRRNGSEIQSSPLPHPTAARIYRGPCS